MASSQVSLFIPNSEEEKSQPQFFAQELIMRIQTERQKEPLREQQELYTDLRKQEAHMIGKILIATTFHNLQSEYSDWEFASFFPGGSGIDPAAEIRGTWRPANLHASVQGLQLRSIILRSKSRITLRTLGCEVKASFRLIEDSTIWIITRGAGVRDPDSVICKVRKEKDSQRVFVIFGGPVGPSHEFKFFKKQEIPEISDNGEDAIAQDFVDIKMSFIDNGDDKVFIQASGKV